MKYQSIRGMQDMGPKATLKWQKLEKYFRDICAQFAFKEVRTPYLEETALFVRSTGEGTDIVEKEMYSFDDKEKKNLTLRPEGTAGVVRAVIENNWVETEANRLYYMGPMFRYERPQKGRFRQFTQWGIESFSTAKSKDNPNPNLLDSDVEVLLLSNMLFKKLGIEKALTLNLNSLGSPETLLRFKEALVSYLAPQQEQLDEDSRRRLSTNPLRILDSKNEATLALLEKGPVLSDFWSVEEQALFENLKEMLNTLEIPFVVNPKLVRGLDYYTGLIFEWVTNNSGAQNAVCSGGRYDALVENLGGKSMPAVGWGLGVERLLDVVLDVNPNALEDASIPEVYILWQGIDALAKAFFYASILRTQGCRVEVTKGEVSFKKQMIKASNSGAPMALIVGEEEVKTNRCTVRNLMTREQETLSWEEVLVKLKTDGNFKCSDGE